jgi:two-component system cell cycle response regulator
MKKIQQTGPHAVRQDAPTVPRKAVLYVEDDEANRQVASVRLERKYELLCATSDREACKVLVEHGSRLSLILMDIELRGSAMNGIDLTRLVRGKLIGPNLPEYAAKVPQLDIPILFVTAYDQRYRKPELLAAGADEIIAKPVDFIALHTAMARAYVSRV